MNTNTEPTTEEVRALGKKLWEMGIKARVKEEGRDAKSKWEDLDPGQLAAWDAISTYLLKEEISRRGPEK